MFQEERANQLQLLGRCRTHRQRMHNEAECRTFEGTIDEIRNEALFGGGFWHGCFVDVRTFRLIAHNQAFLRHDLHDLENRGVADGPRTTVLGVEGGMNVPHGARPVAPENAKDLELSGRGCRQGRGACSSL